MQSRFTSGRRNDIAAAAALCVVSVLMPLWTWRAWAEPIVDFGREVYIPWRMLCGERLYADLAYFNGPLSPYLNMVVFKIGSVPRPSRRCLSPTICFISFSRCWRIS